MRPEATKSRIRTVGNHDNSMEQSQEWLSEREIIPAVFDQGNPHSPTPG
jgi:hypothetical protein